MLEIKWLSPVQEVLIKPEVSLEDSTAVPHQKRNLGQRSQWGGALRTSTWLPQLFCFA